jgi:hypothetical protein
MAFKMKGSPMKRNFGIGASPAKQMKPGDLTDEQRFEKDQKRFKDRHKDPRKSEPFTGERQHGLKTLPIEERARLSKERGDKEKREEFMKKLKKNSPAKQKKEKEITTTIKEGEQFKNKKGQSQKDIMDKRSKNVDEATNKAETYDKNVTEHSEKYGGLTKDEHESYTENMKKLNKNIQDMQKLYIHSSDSISNVNRQYDINRKKASDASGLFQKTHDEEIAEKKKSDQKYMDDLNKKRFEEYQRKMNYSTDSLNVANQNYETQQMKDYRTMSASEYRKKYGKK